MGPGEIPTPVFLGGSVKNKYAIILVLIVGLMIMFGSGFYLWSLLYGNAHTKPVIVPMTTVVSTSESHPVLTGSSTPSSPTMTEVTPTPTVVVENPVEITPGYMLGNTIDLASPAPIVLVFRLPEGELASNFAIPLSYKEEDQIEVIFGAGTGTIYSSIGDTLVTKMHSGFWGWQELFATNLELYLRQNAKGYDMTLAESQAKISGLIGYTAYACQIGDGSVKAFSVYDPKAGCSGKKVELKIVAAAVVPHEKVESYDDSIMNVREWFVSNEPGTGFDQLTADGWIVTTCLSRLADQPSDGPIYLHNRVVFGFEVIE
jgi:hypothetical protein